MTKLCTLALSTAHFSLSTAKGASYLRRARNGLLSTFFAFSSVFKKLPFSAFLSMKSVEGHLSFLPFGWSDCYSLGSQGLLYPDGIYRPRMGQVLLAP